jgi:hypothetical protein
VPKDDETLVDDMVELADSLFEWLYTLIHANFPSDRTKRLANKQANKFFTKQ